MWGRKYYQVLNLKLLIVTISPRTTLKLSLVFLVLPFIIDSWQERPKVTFPPSIRTKNYMFPQCMKWMINQMNQRKSLFLIQRKRGYYKCTCLDLLKSLLLLLEFLDLCFPFLSQLGSSTALWCLFRCFLSLSDLLLFSSNLFSLAFSLFCFAFLFSLSPFSWRVKKIKAHYFMFICFDLYINST